MSDEYLSKSSRDQYSKMDLLLIFYQLAIHPSLVLQDEYRRGGSRVPEDMNTVRLRELEHEKYLRGRNLVSTLCREEARPHSLVDRRYFGGGTFLILDDFQLGRKRAGKGDGPAD